MTMIDIQPDRVYLTATGRLARSLKRNFHLKLLSEGSKGWEPLQAMDLNTWMKRAWSGSWPVEMPAGDLYRMNLWKRLCGTIAPPSPLTVDTNLYAILDENYRTMVRHGIDPAAGIPATPLVEWRRKISAAFQEELEAQKLFHPSHFPFRLCRAIEDGRIIPPEKISLAGFESPAPVERELFTALERLSDVEYASLTTGKPRIIEALALPSPDQEILYLIHRLARDAQTIPLHRIGVIVPDMNRYMKALERNLQDVTTNTDGQGLYWFNMTKGVPFSETHLMKAALLPLRFILEGQTRELLFSLFTSPYYEFQQGKRHRIARADIVWRSSSVESGIEELLRVLKAKDPATYDLIPEQHREHLLSFCHAVQRSKKMKGAFWTEQTRALWAHLGFPVLSDEKDAVDSRNLSEIMREIDLNLSAEQMDFREYSSWLTHLASSRIAQTGAAEDAGVQIMGIVESRGLEFDKVYVLGMNEGALPEPVRPLPLLDSTERRRVQGGTAESQYEFGKNAFDNLLSLAPEITLLRAEQEDTKPLAPSPFWPRDEEKRSIDIWNTPDPAWMRAEWLRCAFKGLQERTSPEPPEDQPLIPPPIPETLPVSRVQNAITCPYRFFVEGIMNMALLEDIEPDVSPREKGIRIHRALALFTKRIREQGMDLNDEGAYDLLTACVDDALRNVANTPHWKVERRRWIGEKEAPGGGMLFDWLACEREHYMKGWRCVAEEIDFDSLKIPGVPFSVKGRIDRVDCDRENGIVIWDYKTGRSPGSADIVKHMKECQLPIYLMALQAGHLPPLNPYLKNALLSGGYIRLKSSGDIDMAEIRGIESAIGEWKDALATLGGILESGDFRAEPFPVSSTTGRDLPCEHCPVITLCRMGVWDTRQDETEGERHEATD